MARNSLTDSAAAEGMPFYPDTWAEQDSGRDPPDDNDSAQVKDQASFIETEASAASDATPVQDQASFVDGDAALVKDIAPGDGATEAAELLTGTVAEAFSNIFGGEDDGGIAAGDPSFTMQAQELTAELKAQEWTNQFNSAATDADKIAVLEGAMAESAAQDDPASLSHIAREATDDKTIEELNDPAVNHRETDQAIAQGVANYAAYNNPFNEKLAHALMQGANHGAHAANRAFAGV